LSANELRSVDTVGHNNYSGIILLPATTYQYHRRLQAELSWITSASHAGASHAITSADTVIDIELTSIEPKTVELHCQLP
jgi:hypothetical protein